MSLQETPSRTGKRAIKFSPANIEKIKSFVAQGVNRNKIAERLGVTVGSLKSRVLGWESACENRTVTQTVAALWLPAVRRMQGISEWLQQLRPNLR